VPGSSLDIVDVFASEQFYSSDRTGATLLSADELESAFHKKRGSLFTTGSVRHQIENIQKSYAKTGHSQVTAIPVALVDEKSRNCACNQDSGIGCITVELPLL
jgi:hypothetical protein